MFLIPQCQTLPCRARTEAGGGWGGQQREQTHRKTAARSHVQMRIAAKILEGAFKCVMVNVLEVLGVNVCFSRSSQTADMRSTCGRSFTTLFLFLSEASLLSSIQYLYFTSNNDWQVISCLGTIWPVPLSGLFVEILLTKIITLRPQPPPPPPPYRP